ncbi:MAG: NAD(P)H-quinone oxidoreductase [Alphaproteobacteria bacterium]|nr:MAG: NAD(P)H-quinone oxidoreductase [Alphaproteobacteria bacterium]
MTLASRSDLPRTSMRAVFPREAGGPDVLMVEERPVPSPGEGQVLVEVAFAGVNRHDCNQRARGTAPAGATDILGLEVSGRVAAVGPGVTAPQLGDEVCALTNGGGYAEYVLADAALCLPVPAGMSRQAAAALPEALFTAWLNLVELCEIQAGETVLVHGGASGVGLITIQLAQLFGADVLATAGTDPRVELCMLKGARAAFNYRETDFVEGVLKGTAGRGADIIIDMAGGLYAERNLRALAQDGRVTHLSSGGHPTFAAPLSLIMQKRARITGAQLRPLPGRRKHDIANLLKQRVWPELGKRIVPEVDRVFSLEEATSAHRRLESGENIGKVLLGAA